MDFVQGRNQSGYHGKLGSSEGAGTSRLGANVPPELWLSIFPYLDDKDLRAVTRTCSDFRLLAQPLLFRVLDVSPFFLAYNSDRIIYRPRQYLQATLDRLNFYKSPRIAPAVKGLWVSPYARSGFPARHLADDLNPTLVISAIIDALPTFPNLRSLTWHCIDIHPSWWASIQRQPSLTKLWINSSSILPPSSTDEPLSANSLKVTHLDLDHYAWEGQTTNLVSVHEERLKGVDPLLLSMTVNSEYIRSVSVPRYDTALRLFSVLRKLGSDIRCTLSSLTLPYSSTISEDFVPSLIASPSLKELHLLAPQEDGDTHIELKDSLPPTSLPLLETYQGPYHLLPIFSNVRHSEPRPLRFVELWGLDEPSSMTVCDPYQLEVILEELSLCEVVLKSLEDLSVIVTHITMELAIVVSRFPNLKAIFLESQDSLIPSRRPLQVHTGTELLPESPVSMLYTLLQSHTFPSSLHRLNLITHFKNKPDVDPTAQCVNAAKFLEGLGKSNPHLETIDIRYGTYWTGVIDISWNRHAPDIELQNEDSQQTLNIKVEAAPSAVRLSETTPLRPTALSRSNSDSSISSQAAVEKFFSLPSRPKSTTAIHLQLGNMTFTEQRRAVVLPDRLLPLPPSEVDTSRLGWLAGGVSRVWYLVERIGKMIGEGVGIARN